ncbi:glycoside hydrolase family 105 protein [Marinicrinis lubricantis]|uniref:Glycoside hydrolase family 105 protein n=1 Tax=Marinicrinis lubricantis TaxID=2086470 RepID=A0ABW1ILD9_9BACL
MINRYIGEHPAHSVVFRASYRGGIKRDSEYRYVFDFNEQFPHMAEGQAVYAWSKLWAEREMTIGLSLSCLGPVQVFVNGKPVHRSNLNDDVFPERKAGFRVKLEQGWNHFVLCFTHTATGCGGRFGTSSIKGMPLHFIMPSVERSGREGWLFCEPCQLTELQELLVEGLSEEESELNWYPRREWTPEERGLGQFGRSFGLHAGRTAYAWTTLDSLHADRPGEWCGTHEGSLEVWLNGQLVYKAEHAGSFAIPLAPRYAEQHIVIRSSCTGQVWGFATTSLSDGYAFEPPVSVQGSNESWFYLGPVAQQLDPEELCRMDRVFPAEEGETYWKIDEPDTWIRPFMENALFGKWNYPLGVTLYGILKSGIDLGRSDYTDYVLKHIECCTSYDRYALWDKEQYGAAGLNHQLSAIDTLDDCGSFGAVTLTAMNQRPLRGAREAVDRVAHYISNVQDRLPDGTLYRAHGSTDFMQDTIWCDDLYMSTPFLTKYYELTGEETFLNDAAHQFLQYKKYLYMPEQQIMSHVYDMKFDKQTGVPWGRGNGWVLFSLTELLTVMPETHEMRQELMAFYRELCEGFLKLQGPSGMWHQVLTDHDSYAETSCTSMFIYSFARGVRLGWLEDTLPYAKSSMRGWTAIVRHALDKFGNVYGVCKGSGYSFTASYYKDRLSWNLNDTHGIGIVLLAGTELMQMMEG